MSRWQYLLPILGAGIAGFGLYCLVVRYGADSEHHLGYQPPDHAQILDLLEKGLKQQEKTEASLQQVRKMLAERPENLAEEEIAKRDQLLRQRIALLESGLERLIESQAKLSSTFSRETEERKASAAGRMSRIGWLSICVGLILILRFQFSSRPRVAR